MRCLLIFCLLCSCGVVGPMGAAQIQTFAPTYAMARRVTDGETPRTNGTPAAHRSSADPQRFTYRDPAGRVDSAEIVRGFQPAKIDPRLSPTLMRAASIAQERAYAHSKSRCWRYVKEALLAAGAVTSRPQTEYAKEAASELVTVYGFKRLPITDPYAAPIGAVLVYGAGRAAGHVEIRTRTGFVSDFRSATPSKRPLIGVFAKA